MPALDIEPKVTVMLLDEGGRIALPSSKYIRVLRLEQIGDMYAIRNVFIMSTGEQLQGTLVSRVIHDVSRARRLRGLLIRCQIEPQSDPLWMFEIMRMARIAAGNRAMLYSQPIIVKRILEAQLSNSAHNLIAHATVVGEYLIVMTCNLETLSIPFCESPLERVPRPDRNDFEIDDDGFSILWPKSGIHLDLGGLRAVIDPALQAGAIRAGRLHNEEYGRAIRNYRLQAKIRQQDVVGLSDRQVSRIENGEQRATSTAISHFADAHGLSVNEYMEVIAELMHEELSQETGRQRVRLPRNETAVAV